ncbi:MAG: diacylglycerol kinase family lipid kinase [Bacillota bacterium]|nr:diacylglycerol kinase family lipid kinase [Bacillota bacterium]
MDWYFIVNPVAGRNRTARLWPLMERIITDKGIPFRAAFTTAPDEARDLAARAAHEGSAAIVGVGGDGTTGEIVNGVLSSTRPDTPIGAIPTGTGNDFVRGQGFPLSWESVLRAILESSRPNPVDAFAVEDARGNRRYAINSVGIGFDAHVAHLAHSRRWLKRLGPLAYAFGAVGGLVTFRPTDSRVVLDGVPVHSDGTWLVACTNTERLAGGMKICPGANAGDGRLNLCVASGISAPRILEMMVLSFQGKHAGRPGIHLLSGREAVISAERPLPVHIDGDPVPFQLPLTLRVLEGAIRLLVPAG